MTKRNISETNVVLRKHISTAIQDWMQRYGRNFDKEELFSLTFNVFKYVEDYFKTFLEEVDKEKAKNKKFQDGRWARYRHNGAYIIANLPKKQAILAIDGALSVHGLDGENNESNIYQIKALVTQPDLRFFWYNEGSEDYLHWKRLMGRWNSYADKTTPVTELKVKKD